MADYNLGGPLKQSTAIEKTGQIAAFLRTRMVKAIEGNDAVELHYLLATLDDYHNFLWRYYRQLEKEQAAIRQNASESARKDTVRRRSLRFSGLGRAGGSVERRLTDRSRNM